ncbi:MAG: hypothetical protein JO290_08460 [Sphingomonadaceae bacterium]|nr:hypothetical protein [Sphingomonadaceae bacterium]
MAWIGITGHGAIALATVANPATSPAPVTIVHVAELPKGVQAKLPHPMVDPGQPFQVSDVCAGDCLPFARLIAARRDGATWIVDYERGGIARGRIRATLEPAPGGYTVRHAPLPKVPKPAP